MPEPGEAIEVPGHAFYREAQDGVFVIYALTASATWVPHESATTGADAKRLTRKLDGRLRRAHERTLQQRQHHQGAHGG